ncbi:hypothetical protein TDB9533_00187 [Thalassocella blandensis]|nr:hypothetical protein TDB9533_00187 [Thalassocella blandensis]
MLSVDTSALFTHLQEQHVDEAALLWGQRAYALKQVGSDMARIAKLERRIDSHLRCIKLHESHAWPFVERNAQEGDASDLFVMSILALIAKDGEKFETVLSMLRESLSLLPGVASALGWLPAGTIERLLLPKLRYWKNSGDVLLQHLFLLACSVRRITPEINFSLMKAAPESVEEADMYARAARLAGEMKLHEAKKRLAIWLQSDHLPLQFWSAWSLVLLGDELGLNRLLTLSLTPNEYQFEAINLSARRLPLAAAQDLVRSLAKNKTQTPQAILAVSALGLVDSMDWLHARMSDPKFGYLAGHAFNMITGIDLVREELYFTQDKSEDDEVMPLDGFEQLPCPDPVAIAKHWNTVSNRFVEKHRYLCGHRIADMPFNNIVASGLQGHRRAAAIEWACSTVTRVLPNINNKVSLDGAF